MGLPARKIKAYAEKKIEEVSLSLDGRRLIFVFESGEGYSIPRAHLSADDGSSITSLEILDHRGAVAIRQASGNRYELPWDSIKYYAAGGHPKKLSLGHRLSELRKERGMSQQALAKRAEISRMQLSRIEGNQSQPGLETLLKICRVLKISPRHLVSQI